MINHIKWILRLSRDIFMIPLVMLMPRNKRKIIFGAWGGRMYSCNPKYLFEYMADRGGFKCIWIGGEHLRAKVESFPGAHFARKGSLLAFWHCITAGFYACNVQWKNDIIDFPRCRRVILLYLTHGYPDKKMGDFQYNGNGAVVRKKEEGSPLRIRLRHYLVKFDDFLYGQKSWFSASSPQGARLRVENLPFRLSYDRMLKAGIPRADFAIQNANNSQLIQKLKEKYSKILGIPADKKWYVFVPTWRHEEKYLFSFLKSDRIADYQAILKSQNAILIEKQHNITLSTLNIPGGLIGSIMAVSSEQSKQIDMQELQLASERLITDYSGVYYDTVLMNRPVLHFVYDFDHFMDLDFGFCFDIRDYGGGPFAYTEDELMNFMCNTDEELLKMRSPKTTSEQLTWEQGHACESYYNLLTQLSLERKYLVP